MRKLLGCIFCSILGFVVSLNAQEKKAPLKTYISLDQLYIDSGGIFVNLNGHIFQTSSLYHDADGIFILNAAYQEDYCPNGHRSPDRDGRCAVSRCPYYKYPDR